MYYSVDHVILSVSPDEAVRLADELTALGFSRRPGGHEIPSVGARNSLYAWAGGGSFELLEMQDAEVFPPAWQVGQPRITGFGFASDDFDADTDWTDVDYGHWVYRPGVLNNMGYVPTYTAAGPQEHKSAHYFFAMSQPDGMPDPNSAGPKLSRLTFRGRDAATWAPRIAHWLRAPSVEGLSCGGVDIDFEHAEDTDFRLSLAFTTTGLPGTIELDHSRIVCEPAS